MGLRGSIGAAGESERGMGGGLGEREKHSQPSSKPIDSTAHQSIDTTSKKYPPEKII
jgi:hypothetical protein